MSDQFCEHLNDYGLLYSKAEASYRNCNSLVERILAEGPDRGQVELLTAALEEWQKDDREMREALVILATTDKIKIPRKKPHAHKRHGSPRCAVCGFPVPKLKFPEWNIAANGTVAFQGNELPVGQPAPVG